MIQFKFLFFSIQTSNTLQLFFKQIATKQIKTMNSSKTSQQHNFDEPLHENQLEELYIWLDAIPLSRKKKNLSRDFSDASK